eukprot:gene2016-2483_t
MQVDLNDPEILKNIKLVQESEEYRWVALSYVPKSNNKIKVFKTGNGDLLDLKDEALSDSSIRYAYIRFTINNMKKFCYIAWCGDGVNGPIKGFFSGHAIEIGKILKPVHYQLNARSELDIDEKAILTQLTKATGASYDSGARVQGNTRASVAIPTSVAQGREQATKSNAEIKNSTNRQDYNKIQESSEFWKQNQQAAKEEVKPARPEYNLTSQRDNYWKEQQQQTQTSAPAPKASVPAPSRTVANKFQQSTQQQEQQQQQPARPAPSTSKSVLNRFPAASTTPTTSAPPSQPSRSAPSRPAYVSEPEPEPQYEEPQQQYEEPAQQYEEQQQHYEEPAQQYEEQQQHYEEPAQQYEEQQHYEEQQQHYEEPAQQYEEPQQDYYQEEQQQQQQHYEEPQQQYEEQQQHYEEQAQSGAYQVEAAYEYVGENEGDLSFREGDIITVLDTSDPDGWYLGELNGVQGYFPSNFVKNL